VRVPRARCRAGARRLCYLLDGDTCDSPPAPPHHVALCSVSSTTLDKGSLKLSFPPFTTVSVALCTRQRLLLAACVSLHVRRAPRARLAVGADGRFRHRSDDEGEELRGSACAISLSTAGFQSLGAPPSREARGLGEGRP